MARPGMNADILAALDDQMGAPKPSEKREIDDSLDASIDLEQSIPLFDAVLVTFEMPKEEKAQKVSAGGIIMSREEVRKEKKYIRAKVVRLPVGNYDANGKEVPLPLGIGDIILIQRNSGIGLVSGKTGVPYKIVRLKEIVMILKKV